LETLAHELLSIEEAYDPATETLLSLPNGYGSVEWWSPWGYKVHLTQKAINALNNLGGVAESSAAIAGVIVALTGSALVTTAGVAGLIAGALAVRAKVMYWIADGGDLDLYSPWCAILALIPVKADAPWAGDDRMGFSVLRNGSWADGKPFLGGSTSEDGRGTEPVAQPVPMFASYRESLFAAFHTSDRVIYYCVYDPKAGGDNQTGWSDAYQVGVYGRWPNLIEYRGSLYLFFVKNDGEIWWTRYDRGWRHEQALRGGHAYTADRVGLAVFQDKLYVLARGNGSDENVWMSTFDGDVWSPYAKIGATSSHGPALATFGGEMHMIASGGGNDHRIWHYHFDGSRWKNAKGLDHVFTDSMPALTVFDDKLYCAARGMENGIWYMSYSGGSWSTYTETQLRSRYGPSLSAYTDKLSNRQDLLLCYDPRM
jgi:hypothetical protein